MAAGGTGQSIHRQERHPVVWKYSQPQRGGQIKMRKDLYDKYKTVFNAMTIAKYDAALILNEINGMESFPFKIQEYAVKAALDDIDHHIIKVRNNMSELSLVSSLALGNLYSLVAYPVGYHYDVFKDGQYCLENKICFSFPSEKLYDIGRGGCGSDRFVFAILDWTNSRAGKRRCEYINNGGVLRPGQSLTQQMVDELMTNN